ncbi:hypothetical protein HYX14_02710 [Candidatus Woesearchaeota archaeon]|nr:hypothetical protein [Candidatus Woesearchaeota archaeon]
MTSTSNYGIANFHYHPATDFLIRDSFLYWEQETLRIDWGAPKPLSMHPVLHLFEKPSEDASRRAFVLQDYSPSGDIGHEMHLRVPYFEPNKSQSPSSPSELDKVYSFIYLFLKRYSPDTYHHMKEEAKNSVRGRRQKKRLEEMFKEVREISFYPKPKKKRVNLHYYPSADASLSDLFLFNDGTLDISYKPPCPPEEEHPEVYLGYDDYPVLHFFEKPSEDASLRVFILRSLDPNNKGAITDEIEIKVPYFDRTREFVSAAISAKRRILNSIETLIQ